MMAKESHSGPLRVKITRHKNQKEYYKAPSKGSKGKTIRPNWLHGKFTHLCLSIEFTWEQVLKTRTFNEFTITVLMIMILK